MSKAAPATTTQISKVELPQWVDQASQANYNFATQVANKPLVQYQGPTVAGVSPGTQQAWDTAAGAGKVGAGDYSGAEGAYAGAVGQGPSYVTPGMLANTDLSPYLNPYTNTVVSNAMRDLDVSRQQAIMGNADKASSSNAFGGSRQGLTDAVTNAQSALAAGTLSGQLRSQAYDKSMGYATSDLDRLLSGQLANQKADQNQQQVMLAAGAGLKDVGDSLNTNNARNFTMQSMAGQQQQGQEQAVLDANKAKFDEANNYDTDRLNILLSSLGMSPYGKTQTTNTTQKAATTGTDWSQIMLAALGVGADIFKASDRTMKTDIQKVGKHKPSGLPIYAYRYKEDPKHYPKVIGPMAQDIRSKFGPAAAPRIGGKLAINPAALAAKLGVGQNGMGALGSLAPAPGPSAVGLGGNAPPSDPMAGAVAGLGRGLGPSPISALPARPKKNRLALGPRMPRLKGSMGGMGGLSNG